MKESLINLCLCFILSIVFSPFVIRWLKKLKFGQNILVYVEQHKGKSGTPTMGGVIFILSAIVGFFVFFNTKNSFATLSILAFLFFGVLGFLDDFIKIKFKQNEGLKPYQKVIGQLGLSLIIAIFIYMSGMLGGKMYLPFSNKQIDIGFWIIPFVVIFYVAVVNSVNLIDGLDGLCSSVSSIVMAVFGIVLLIVATGLDGKYLVEIEGMIVVVFGVVGAVLGFLCFNSYPAKVFMGDTGSLALGGFIATIFALSKQYLLVVVIGFAFVLTALSVVIQVVGYKLTKKRVFKMAPLHHHFEVFMHESKICSMYSILTLIIGILTIIVYI